MITQSSKKVRLKDLSAATGIDSTELQKLLDAPAVADDATTTGNINATDDIPELWEILKSLSGNQPEYQLCYDKLTNRLREEIAETDDLDELRDMFMCTPGGSPEETELEEKIFKLETDLIDKEKNFETLIEWYGDYKFQFESDQLMIEKMILLASTPEKTKRLLDDVFNVGAPAYYTTASKHNDCINTAIEELKDVDDADTIYDWILSTKDIEVIRLAEKIVQIGSDSETIWGKEYIFTARSEAKEILALAAIDLTNEFSDDEDDPLNQIIRAYKKSSRIGRAAREKRQKLLCSYTVSLTDTEELTALLGVFAYDNTGRKAAENHLVDLTELADLKELIESDNSSDHLIERVGEKLSMHVENAIATATKAGDLSKYIEMLDDTSELCNDLCKRIVELAENKSDLDNITLPKGSYAIYLFATKFGNGTQAHRADTAHVPDNKVNDEQRQKDSETYLKIKKITNCKDAILFHNRLGAADKNKTPAYNHASDLLKKQLLTNPDERTLKSLLLLFPRTTTECSDIVKSIATFYPKKPWYQFW